MTSIEIEIELATGAPRERAAEAQLWRLLGAHDLDGIIVTRRVRIESGVVPHSHPVLTLNTRHLDDDPRQLAVFIHEQLHWYVAARPEQADAAIADLRATYLKVPVGGTAGARSAESTYLHLVICFLEWRALEHYLGRQDAMAVIGRIDIYRWIYDTVVRDAARIDAVLRAHDLTLPSG